MTHRILPADGPVSEKPYALLREVMKQSARWRRKGCAARCEDLVAVFAHDNGLVLQKLRYPHEVRSIQDVPNRWRPEGRQE